MGLRTQAKGIPDVACADLRKQLPARRHRLGLERLLGRAREDFGRDEPGQQLVLGNRVDHRHAAVTVDGDVDTSRVGAGHLELLTAALAARFHAQGGVAGRHEPQHTLVAHLPARLSARGFELAVGPVDQLGENAGLGQRRLRGQALQRALGLLG